MATTYEQTTTVTQGRPDEIRPDPTYIRTIPGILKIVEIFLDVLILICASIDPWYSVGGGWVQFVAASAMITTVLIFIFHFLNLASRLAAPWVLIEFVYYVIYVVLFFIAAIVAAVKAPYWPAVGAACFFTFAALAVYAVDCFFMYRTFSSLPRGGTTTTTTGGEPGAVTTTTTTTYETRTQY